MYWKKVFEAGEKGDFEYLKSSNYDFTQNIETLFRAVQNGHLECVAFLLPLSDLRQERGEIKTGHTGILLQTAVRNNNHAMVELLLPHCNPKVDSSLALQYASLYGDMDMVDLLYNASNVEEALLDMSARIDQNIWEDGAADLLKARVQRDVIASHIPPKNTNTVRKI